MCDLVVLEQFPAVLLLTQQSNRVKQWLRRLRYLDSQEKEDTARPYLFGGAEPGASDASANTVLSSTSQSVAEAVREEPRGMDQALLGGSLKNTDPFVRPGWAH